MAKGMGGYGPHVHHSPRFSPCNPRLTRITAPWRGIPTLSASSQRDGKRQPLLILEFHFALLASNMLVTLLKREERRITIKRFRQ